MVGERARRKRRGSAATIFSTGSGSMITPVENGSTSPGAQSSIEATAAHVLSAAAIPAVAGAGIGIAGVDDQRAQPALALKMLPAYDHRRGAKAVLGEHAGGVRCPASNTARSRSSRCHRLIFAAAVPSLTPETGNNWSGAGGV